MLLNIACSSNRGNKHIKRSLVSLKKAARTKPGQLFLLHTMLYSLPGDYQIRTRRLSGRYILSPGCILKVV